MKRKPLGVEGLRAVQGGSSSVLHELAGLGESAESPPPAAAPEVVPARAAAARAKSAPARAIAPAAAAEVDEKYESPITVSVQMFKRQKDALDDAAYRRKKKRGGGRQDASVIVRELIDRWIAEGAE